MVIKLMLSHFCPSVLRQLRSGQSIHGYTAIATLFLIVISFVLFQFPIYIQLGMINMYHKLEQLYSLLYILHSYDHIIPHSHILLFTDKFFSSSNGSNIFFAVWLMYFQYFPIIHHAIMLGSVVFLQNLAITCINSFL